MQKSKNEVNSPKFEIRPASSEKAGLFYAQHPAEDERLGCMEQASAEISEWDEALIRQLVDTVKVVSAEKITVYLRGGIQIEQNMIQ